MALIACLGRRSGIVEKTKKGSTQSGAPFLHILSPFFIVWLRKQKGGIVWRNVEIATGTGTGIPTI